MTEDAAKVRTEKDGRRARGKQKPRCQTSKDAYGRTTYKKQLTNPVTRRREWVRADTEDELFARVDEIRRTRRNLRHHLLAPEDALRAVELATQKPRMLRDVWERWKRSGKRASRWQSKLTGYWLNHIAPRFGNLTVYDLSADRLSLWLEWMREKTTENAFGTPQKLSGKTISNVWWSMQACVRSLVETGVLESVPWKGWKVELDVDEKRRGLGVTKDGFESPQELQRAMAVAEEIALRAARTSGDLPDLPFRIGIMAYLGLRRSEAIALSWDQIRRESDGRVVVRVTYAAKEGWRQSDEDSQAVPLEFESGGEDGDKRERKMAELIRPLASPKGGKVRAIAIDPEGPVLRMLGAQAALLKSRNMYQPNGPVFPDRSGRFRARDCVKPATVREVARRAGLMRPGRTWDQHSLRHSAIRMTIAAGATLREAQELAGHAHAMTTEVYFKDMGRQGRVGQSRADVREALEAMALERDAVSPEALFPASAPVLQGEASTFAAEGGLFDKAEKSRQAAIRAHEKYLGRKLHPLARFVGDEIPHGMRVPCAVMEIAKANYRKAYNKARRAGLTLAEQREAGFRAKRAILGAYGTAEKAELRKAAPKERPRLELVAKS